jgi:predicted permease
MLFQKFLPLAVMFVFGFVLKKTGFLKREYSGTLGTILISFVVPAAIGSAFAKASLDQNFLSLPFIGGATVVILLGIGYGISHMLGLKGKTRGSFLISFPTLEGGTIGYALMFAAFGEIGLSRIALFDFGNALVEFSLIYGLAVMLGGAKTNQSAIASSLGELFKMPPLWGMFGGIALNILGIGNNAILQDTLGAVGTALIPLVMLLLSLEFEPKVSFSLPFFTFIAKLASGFLVGLAMIAIFHFEGIERIAVLIGTTLPTSLMAIIFSKENNLDTEFVATLIAIALPAYLILFGIALSTGLI